MEFNYKLNTFAKILKVVHSQCLQKVIEMGVLVLVGRVDWSLTYSKPFSYIVSVFYCYITNYHKFSILKQQTFTMVSVGQESRKDLVGFSAWDLKKL